MSMMQCRACRAVMALGGFLRHSCWHNRRIQMVDTRPPPPPPPPPAGLDPSSLPRDVRRRAVDRAARLPSGRPAGAELPKSPLPAASLPSLSPALLLLRCLLSAASLPSLCCVAAFSLLLRCPFTALSLPLLHRQSSLRPRSRTVRERVDRVLAFLRLDRRAGALGGDHRRGQPMQRLCRGHMRYMMMNAFP